MDNFFSFIINAANYLCGMPVLYAASVVSIILTISTRGFVFRHFRHIVHQIVNMGSGRKNQRKKAFPHFRPAARHWEILLAWEISPELPLHWLPAAQVHFFGFGLLDF